MAVNTQFSIAVHIMAGLGYDCRKDRTFESSCQKCEYQPELCPAYPFQIVQGRFDRYGQGEGGGLLAG